MHCELIVPALLPQDPHAAQVLGDLRLPGLELLLASRRAGLPGDQPGLAGFEKLKRRLVCGARGARVGDLASRRDIDRLGS